MSLVRCAWMLTFLAAVAGCAGTLPSGADNLPDNGASSDAAVINDMGSPRERARAHTELAAGYYDLGNMGVALEEARIALAADGNYAPAYNVLGLVHMDLREKDAAQAYFERALQLSPNDPDANHNYGWFLCQTGREQQAQAYFLSAVRNPLYATPQKSYTLAGSCAMRRKDEAQALDMFERALRFDPNYLPAVLSLANVRYVRGELDVARNLVTRFNRLSEPTAESLWLALRIEHRLGERSAEASLADQIRRNFAGSREYQSLQKGLYD